MSIHRKMKLGIVFAIAASLILTACGPAAPAQSSPPPGAAATESPAPSRVVKHAMGESTVPGKPQRVVTLDTGELDGALALGIKPVGAATWWSAKKWPDHLTKDQTDGVTWVGLGSQPNLELIASLRPDLILGNKARHEAIYAQLSRIAPTVMAESIGVVWKQNFELVAQALGKKAEHDAVMADYYKRAADLKIALGPTVLANTEVTVLRSVVSSIRLQLPASFTGTVFDDAGIKRPENQRVQEFARNVTREAIPDLNADVIFLSYYTGDASLADSEKIMNDLKADPLWSSLRAVKANRVYVVADDAWFTAIGVLGAFQVIADLHKHLRT